MPLLPEDKLIWSPIVVNCRMNRQRNASGINSYEQELRFKPEIYLETLIQQQGQASWIDLCCGEGKALAQTAQYLCTQGLQKHVTLTGIDLLDTLVTPAPNLQCLHFQAMSLANWTPTQSYDLITCIHGLHYVGDKLKVIETAIKALRPSGVFVANLDLRNIVIQGVRTPSYLKSIWQQYRLTYQSRRKLLSGQGPAEISFGVQYLGADDTSGKNYTGQEAVTSYYDLLTP